ncbi:hypothetical protein CKA55_09400 [Arcobacter suis]|uniref:Periplasmic substrate-binding protein n=1 Tax=Arcobacter suis CECT 7833 TaxID=663365 RepID=A0AAD0WQ67_9BACT|nr:zinc ABC transporter substrate-binding protein [Arcobacter suis]AXX89416.1 periplasmic substrate-binding protein [Arcobacter suis CECT 7833]RWS46163.1 hypothetical protein CKA55_09400 [Arcobacter suis]
MFKIIFLLLFPLFLFSKNLVVTYFPLETNLVNKIAQKEIKTREITSRYLNTYKDIPISEISKLANSKIFFHFGLEVEKQYAEVLLRHNPKLVIVDISANVSKIENNPYIWTDPLNLRAVAKNIYEAFAKYDKSKESYYKENYEKFLDEIDQTFLKIKQKLNNSEIQYIYVFDDFWEYFAKRFGITTVFREKKYLSSNELSQVNEFTKDKNITKLLFSKEDKQDFINSLTKNLNINAIEDDIFNDSWQLNILNFVEQISE